MKAYGVQNSLTYLSTLRSFFKPSAINQRLSGETVIDLTGRYCGAVAPGCHCGLDPQSPDAVRWAAPKIAGQARNDAEEVDGVPLGEHRLRCQLRWATSKNGLDDCAA